MCNDYRAGATIDVEHDRQALEDGRKIRCPALVLWGNAGIPGESGNNPLDVWRRWAVDVRGEPLGCGHFLAEEEPQRTIELMLEFLRTDKP
jgi:haloacetate dehalogenase